MIRYWKACGNFVGELRRNFNQIGAVLPSSPFLARAMTRHLRGPRPPLRLLEVGAGTGAITAAILRRLRPGDRLDLVEINEHFVHHLRRRLAGEWRVFQPQVRVLHSPVEDLPGFGCYDYLVSGLPLNLFPADLVRDILGVYRRLLAAGGTLTFFEYTLIRELRSPFVGPRERRRLHQIGRLVGGFVRKYQFKAEQVLANVPPATVRHLRLPGGEL